MASHPVSVLQRRLARQIVAQLRNESCASGDPVNQLAMAEMLGVSRTPVRAALTLLSEAGIVARRGRGVIVADLAAGLPADDDATDPVEALITRLARDRHCGALSAEASEADLMRRYSATRADVTAALRHFADLGLAMRKPGFGWRFVAEEGNFDDRRASYRFRLAIEPAALLEPGYVADAAWLADMRHQHEHFMARRWRAGDAVPFFEMNAAFHMGLVGFSGNRFFIQATQQQNNLRRLRNYSWTLGEERVLVSCQDHLEIITAVSNGELATAAERMRRHLADTAAIVARSSGPAS